MTPRPAGVVAKRENRPLDCDRSDGASLRLKYGPQIKPFWGLRCAMRNGYNTKMREYYVYILAKKRNGALYIGMSKDLAKRVATHQKGRGSKFVQKYSIYKLVYYEKVKGHRDAHSRERQLKWWKRKWKLALIEQMNPEWKDLREEILDPR